MNIINKFCLIALFLLTIFNSNSGYAVENLEIVVCDGCINQQYEDKVLSASIVNDTVVVMDVLNRRLRAYHRNVEVEPGYRGISLFEDAVPYQHQVAFDEYLQIFDLINSTHKTQKVWSDIPIQLSTQGVENATATIVGVPYPIHPVLCNNFCVEIRSVNDVFKNLDAQRFIGLELNKAYTATLTMRFKIIMHKMLTQRAFVITVKF